MTALDVSPARLTPPHLHTPNPGGTMDDNDTPGGVADWDDLRARLIRAFEELNRMSVERSDSRLMGKADGVRLALSYMDDYR